ncbi:MAG: hypothetical protein ACREVA_08100 [Burkholderiales bacterium]
MSESLGASERGNLHLTQEKRKTSARNSSAEWQAAMIQPFAEKRDVLFVAGAHIGYDHSETTAATGYFSQPHSGLMTLAVGFNPLSLPKSFEFR